MELMKVKLRTMSDEDDPELDYQEQEKINKMVEEVSP